MTLSETEVEAVSFVFGISPTRAREYAEAQMDRVRREWIAHCVEMYTSSMATMFYDEQPERSDECPPEPSPSSPSSSVPSSLG